MLKVELPEMMKEALTTVKKQIDSETTRLQEFLNTLSELNGIYETQGELITERLQELDQVDKNP